MQEVNAGKFQIPSSHAQPILFSPTLKSVVFMINMEKKVLKMIVVTAMAMVASMICLRVSLVVEEEDKAETVEKDNPFSLTCRNQKGSACLH